MHSREEPSCVPPPRPLRAAPPADECGAGSLARSYQSARPFLPKRRGSLPGMQSATCGRLHAARPGSARRADAQPVTGTHNILQRRGLADHGTRRTPRPDLTKACSEAGWPATGEQRGASWQPRVQNTWQRHIVPHLMQNRQLAIRLRVSERSCVRSTHQATPKPRLFSLVVERSLRIDFRRFFFYASWPPKRAVTAWRTILHADGDVHGCLRASMAGKHACLPGATFGLHPPPLTATSGTKLSHPGDSIRLDAACDGAPVKTAGPRNVHATHLPVCSFGVLIASA